MNEWTFLLGQSVSPWKLLLKIIIITLMGGNEKDQAEQKNISQMYVYILEPYLIFPIQTMEKRRG